MRGSMPLIVAGSILGILACDTDRYTGPADDYQPVPLSVLIASGDAQEGAVGEWLDAPLTVLTTDPGGTPMRGWVIWRVTGGEGLFAIDDEPVTRIDPWDPWGWRPDSVLVSGGSDGHARIPFMPLTDGPITVLAKAGSSFATLDDSVLFHVRGQPVPITLSIHRGADQAGLVDQWLEEPLQVRVKNLDGEPVPARVKWAITEGEALLSSDPRGLSEWGSFESPDSLVIGVDRGGYALVGVMPLAPGTLNVTATSAETAYPAVGDPVSFSLDVGAVP